MVHDVSDIRIALWAVTMLTQITLTMSLYDVKQQRDDVTWPLKCNVTQITLMKSLYHDVMTWSSFDPVLATCQRLQGVYILEMTGKAMHCILILVGNRFS